MSKKEKKCPCCGTGVLEPYDMPHYKCSKCGRFYHQQQLVGDYMKKLKNDCEVDEDIDEDDEDDLDAFIPGNLMNGRY